MFACQVATGNRRKCIAGSKAALHYICVQLDSSWPSDR